MSRFAHPLPFSPDYEFQASKPVTLNGRAYTPGDRIEKDALGARRLRQLYEARIITPLAPAAAALLRPQPASSDAQDLAPQEQPQEALEAVVGAAGKQAVHKGFGRWFVVDADGNELAGPMTKDEALAQAAG
jgi:hypothetical protein